MNKWFIQHLKHAHLKIVNILVEKSKGPNQGWSFTSLLFCLSWLSLINSMNSECLILEEKRRYKISRLIRIWFVICSCKNKPWLKHQLNHTTCFWLLTCFHAGELCFTWGISWRQRRLSTHLGGGATCC